MRDFHRSILKNTGQVMAGVAAGAVSGFALLSLRFVAANQFPSHGVAMIVVLVAAVAGGVGVGVVLWRQRPVRDEATEPLLVRVRPFDKLRERSFRRSAAAATAVTAGSSSASVPDAA